MNNTLSYEIGTVVILVILLIAKSRFLRLDGLNLNFKRSAYALIACAVVNAVLEAASGAVWIWDDRQLVVTKTLYGLLFMVFLIIQFRTVCLRVEFRSDIVRLYNLLLGVGFFVFSILNIIYRMSFEYRDGILIQENLYVVYYIAYGLVYVETLVVGIALHKKLRTNVFFCTILLVVYPILGFASQFVWADSLFLDISSGMALLLYGFSLGDQDYKTLQETKARLVESGEAQQKSRHDVEMAYGVKNRFIRKVSTDFMDPIEGVRRISQSLLNESTDAQVSDYVKQIMDADMQLGKVVDSLMEAAEGDR